MTTQPIQNNHPGGDRDNRNLLPLWRVRGTIRLLTPLSIGSGSTQPIQIRQQDGSLHDRHVVAVTLDHRGLPYIAASSFKGALNALAQDCNLSEAHRSMFFGVVQADKTKPGAVEFCNLMLASAPQRDSALPHWHASSQTANVEHVVRNRDYGTAQEQLLFLEQTVVPKSEFTFECTVRGVNEEAIRDLLGLLALAGQTDSPLRLGAGKASDNGRISWSLTDVQLLDDPAMLWQSLLGQTSTTPLQLWAAPVSRIITVVPSSLTLKPDQWLALPALALNFHSPFLVYHSVPKSDQQVDSTGASRQVVPRANHAGRAILPTDSLHGALRSQAERILRTLDMPVVEGYKLVAAADVKAVAKLDLAAILFGAPGWGSVLRISDFVVQGQATTLTHEMLAIDRLTGGGKDGAKFTIEALDCPELAGQIALDLRRLALVEAECPGVAAKALGLLAHVLRDLDEGDLPLGYGAAKGYGRCRSNTVAVLSQALARAKSSLAPSLAAVLQAFASAAVNSSTAGNSPQAAGMQLNNTQPLPVPTPTQAAGDFHNPYLFIPFGKAKPDDKRLPWLSHDDIGNAASHHRHSRYASNAWHGRLLCRLTTTTPIFIGAGDEPGTSDPKQKQNFKLNGEIALPATSLRGMLSSLHESITGSALRVMDESGYSLRQQTGGDTVNVHASSAIGRVHKDGKKVFIEPLTLPTLSSKDSYQLPNSFRDCFPDWHGDGSDIEAFHKVMLEPQHMQVDINSHYQQEKATQFSGSRSQGYWYMPLVALRINTKSNWQIRDSNVFRLKSIGQNDFLIGQRPAQMRAFPRSEEEFNNLSESDKRGYVRGFLRVMNYQGRQLPPATVRKYELFIPYPSYRDDFDPFLIPCSELCVERFLALAAERRKQQAKTLPDDMLLRVPYMPVNQLNSSDTLQHGDLVYFKPANTGSEVAEISYSSIWRARLESNEQAYKSTQALTDGNQAPLEQHLSRPLLSPSEYMFGYTEIADGDLNTSGAINPVRTFASKVHVGFARPATEINLLPVTTLKILASPKPPSPAMYLQPKNGRQQYVSKQALVTKPELYVFKGTKAYLHALRTKEDGQVQPMDNNGYCAGDRMPWQTAHPADKATLQQKVRITPIAQGNTFVFEVDFNNLSQAELESLCACLCPDASYEHKLGMGKPLGLGSVKIDIAGLYLLDRAARYRQTDFAKQPRYASVWQNSALLQPSVGASVPHLQTEMQDLQTKVQAGEYTKAISPYQLATQQMRELQKQAPAVFNAILLSGNPEAVHLPVHYPQLVNKDVEEETFKWFVDNAGYGGNYRGNSQFLASIEQNSTALPTLSRTPRRIPPTNNR